jgi:hypothetical protein
MRGEPSANETTEGGAMRTMLKLTLIAVLGAALGAVTFAIIPHPGQPASQPPRTSAPQPFTNTSPSHKSIALAGGQ